MKKIQSARMVLILLLVAWFLVSCGNNIKDNKWDTSTNNNTETKIEQSIELSSDEEDMVNEIFDM